VGKAEDTPVSLFVEAIGFGLVTASIVALAAVGFTLQFGITNIFNLAYGAIMTLAAFVAYYVNVKAGYSLGLAFVSAVVAAGVISVAVHYAIYAPFLRRGTQLFVMVIVSVSVGAIILYSLQIVTGVGFYTLRAPPGATVHVFGMIFTRLQLEIIAFALVIMGALHALLRYTQTGRAMRATANDGQLARHCGIPTGRVTALAWLLSGMLCGAAGVTLVLNTVTFAIGTGGDFLLLAIAAAVVGGVGSPTGAMLGALAVGVCSEVTGLYRPELKTAAAFAVLVVVLVIRGPQLTGLLRREG
jgi:branched-chain amino acid transport system permease protein/neutral amino acid transport system permease protein